MATQEMPPVAQFSLPVLGQKKNPATTNQANDIPGMPPVAQFSLPEQHTTEKPQSFGEQALGVAKNVGNFLFPIAGDIKHDIEQHSFTGNGKTVLQQAGDLGLSALPFVPGLGEAGLAAKGAEAGTGALSKGLVSRVIGSPIARGAAVGYGTGVASNLSQGQDIGQSVGFNLNTLGGTLTGGMLSGLINKLGTGALRSSAVEDINKVLSPTTKVNKQITQKIAPRLATEGTTALGREGLLAKYETNMGKVGDALETEYDKLPADAKIDVGGLFDTLNKKINDLQINGITPSAAQSKVNALQNVMKDLLNIGTEVSPDGTQVFSDVGNVRKLRQIMDNSIGKGFSFNDLDMANKAAQKQLANGIREQFGQQYPDIAKLNKDFNFWSNASKVLSDAIERKTGQTGLIRKGLSAGVGAIGTPSHPFIGAAELIQLSEFLSSTGYHTVSAALKNKIADAFERADYAGASRLMQTIPGQAAKGFTGLIPIPQTSNNQFSTQQTAQ